MGACLPVLASQLDFSSGDKASCFRELWVRDESMIDVVSGQTRGEDVTHTHTHSKYGGFNVHSRGKSSGRSKCCSNKDLQSSVRRRLGGFL